MTGDLRSRVDAVLTTFLDERLRAVERLDPAARPPVEEIAAAPGTPAGNGSGPRSATGASARPAARIDADRDEPIVRAAAALELLHTMALVHDDLIDGAKERRGVPSTAAWFAERAGELGAPGDPRDFGQSMAVLVGDVSAVWADRLLLESGFSSEALVPALVVYHEMREQMAVGQSLDVRRRGG